MRRLGVQYGIRLPDRYREWVLHDATCRTWLPRVPVRALVQLARRSPSSWSAIGGAWAAVRRQADAVARA